MRGSEVRCGHGYTHLSRGYEPRERCVGCGQFTRTAAASRRFWTRQRRRGGAGISASDSRGAVAAHARRTLDSPLDPGPTVPAVVSRQTAVSLLSSRDRQQSLCCRLCCRLCYRLCCRLTTWQRRGAALCRYRRRRWRHNLGAGSLRGVQVGRPDLRLHIAQLALGRHKVPARLGNVRGFNGRSFLKRLGAPG